MIARLPGAAAHRVASGQVQLHAETTGEGTPLVLVHGWPLDLRIFTPQVPAISRHHRVIAYDRRGFGRSVGAFDLARVTRRLLTSILEDYWGGDLEAHAAAGQGVAVDVAAALEDLDVPALVLTGALETAARRAHAAAIVTRMPRAREAVLAHSGHLSNLSEPEAYNREVLRFLAEIDAT